MYLTLSHYAGWDIKETGEIKKSDQGKSGGQYSPWFYIDMDR
jgi:hypothetical protein